jgi:hypothetical protein
MWVLKLLPRQEECCQAYSVVKGGKDGCRAYIVVKGGRILPGL